ncbi:evasin P1095-like [Ixodes scapularis]|uniref:evasin P1095-like n=1 Tax=Ixodes scapularis TaxID=6945 RepID=UPI001A9F9259|nr:evasin P1095-like [Ixodes scapularis]
MELNAFTFLQSAVFIAIGYHANLHSTVVGSEVETSDSDSSHDIDVSYCGMNCTVENGVSSGCNEDCVCVHHGNEPNGICITITNLGDLGNPLEDPSIDNATPLTQIFAEEA